MLVTITEDVFCGMYKEGATEPVPKSPYMSRTDWRAIARLCKTMKPKRVLEIGTAWGDSTLWLAKNCPDADILTISLSKEMGIACTQGLGDEVKSEEETGRAFRGKPEAERIRLVFQDSMTLQAGEGFLNPRNFDLVLIDGNHDYEHVKHDTELAFNIINMKDGMVIWHDCRDPKLGVEKVLNEQSVVIFHVDRTQVAFMRCTMPTGD